MNIPNIITIIRILLVPVFVILIINDRMWQALVIFITAGITDGLDGFIARILNQRTVTGAYLDPIADKFLLISAYLALTIKGILPGWLSVVVISRDIIIVSGIAVLSLIGKGINIQPSFSSKITTVFQILTIISTLFFIDGHPAFLKILIFMTAFFTISSGLQYVYRGIKIMGNDK